jgi:hypothetical protein
VSRSTATRTALRRAGAIVALVLVPAVATALVLGSLDHAGRADPVERTQGHAGPVTDDRREPRPRPDHVPEEPTANFPRPEWRDSVALGTPEAGRLVRGVRFPREGRHFFTWDPVERESPNRPWRRWGTEDLVRVVLEVLADHRRAFPRAPRLGVGDLSRPHGGDFGPQYGIIGHATHQNGLDADVYYPRKDGRERAPLSVDEIDLPLAQDLVDRFVAAGAEKVFVGPSTGLTGPPGVVQAISNHDNHLHVRIPAQR